MPSSLPLLASLLVTRRLADSSKSAWGLRARVVATAALALLLSSGCAPRASEPPQTPARDVADQQTTRTEPLATDQLSQIVVLVSLDGFRWDQIEFPEADTLRRLAERGVRAEGLIPVFPSKTFPNHYSIVTGLYPENHGIVSNNMRDDRLGRFRLSDREAIAKSGWWGGEPIWVTAKKAGLVTAAMFWPGSETEIQGVRPDHWFQFDSEKPFDDRVDQVLAWLALPAEQRPRMITLYFEEPDGSNHRFGPSSPEARAAVGAVDHQLERLVEGIERLGLGDLVNLVITSDHGMAEVHSDRIIPLDELATFEPGELFESGAFVQIFPAPGREEVLYQQLRGAHPRLQIFRRHEIPAELHLRNSPRVAPIVGIPEVGWEAMTEPRRRLVPQGPLGGHHGPDPRDERMHGLFVTQGPAIRSGLRIERFENVHIYELLVRLLGISGAPNDGDPMVLAPALRVPDAPHRAPPPTRQER